MKKRNKLLLCSVLIIAMLLSACGSTATDPVSETRTSVSEGNAPDFSVLSENTIGWLVSPEGVINAPVTTAETSDSLYIQTDYNNSDYSDSVTVIYGALTNDGSLFGSLQQTFSENGSLDSFSPLTLYTRDGTKTYKVFGATLYNSNHLLYTFGSGKTEAMLDSIRHYHVMSRQWDDTYVWQQGDQLLILSAHAPQSEDLRYLVLATQIS